MGTRVVVPGVLLLLVPVGPVHGLQVLGAGAVSTNHDPYIRRNSMKNQKEPMTLDKLAVGGSCVIEQVGNQRGAVKRRLIDMGLTPGTKYPKSHLGNYVS